MSRFHGGKIFGRQQTEKDTEKVYSHDFKIHQSLFNYESDDFLNFFLVH